MEFQVNINNVILAQINQVESGEYNVTECNFTFSSEYDGLTKKAVFTNEANETYVETIVDNICSIPSEVLKDKENVKLGVYAYDVDNEELLLRYSPRPTEFYVHEGSYKEGQNSTPPTPSEIEQLQAQITTNANNIEELQECCGKYDSDIEEIKAEQITQNNNIQTNTETIGTITENITIINEALGTINENIGDLQEGQIEQNTKIQNNADDIIEMKQDINEIDSSINDINQNIDDLEQDLTNYSLITETGSQINLNINSSNFQMTAILKDKNGNVIHTSNVIDLPLETMVVGASYDNVTKEVVLTLQNGTTLRFSVADLVEGLVSTDQLTQILSNYYNKNEVDALIPDLTDYVKNTDYATYNKGGTIKSGNGFGVYSTGFPYGSVLSKNDYDNQPNYFFISKGTLENVITGKELINQTQLEESQATQDTEIEALQAENAELKQDITNMAKAMYKVDGQGSDITLQNTSENKFVEFGLEGRTEQEQLTGKNLFDVSTIAIGKALNLVDGSLQDASDKNTSDFIEVQPSETYICNKLINRYVEYDENKQLVHTGTNVDSTPITMKTNAKYFRFSYTSDVINIQFEKNSTPTSYEPYCGGIPSPNPDFPQQIKNVTGNANVKIQNKNLFWGLREFCTFRFLLTSLCLGEEDIPVSAWEGT